MSRKTLWTPMQSGDLFLRLQLPFLAGTLFVVVAAGLAVPSLWTSPLLLAGAGAAVAASVAFVPSRRGWLLTPWGIVVPLVDVVSVALVRAELFGYIPTVGVLCLMPFAWIALRYRWPALSFVLLGGILISALPLAMRLESLSTPLMVLNLVTLPVLTTGISVGIHLAAGSFRRSRREVQDTAESLASTLAQSRDDELVLRTVLDTVNGAVAFYNADGRLVLANRAAQKLAESVGFRFDDPPYAGPNVCRGDRTTPVPWEQQLVPRALRGEVIHNHLEWCGPESNQTAILSSSRQVHRPDGALLGTVIAAYDVTDLADAVEAREEFLTTVSHELRTPLTSVVGYTEHVVDTLGPDAEKLGVAQALSAIARNGEVLLERVSQLLTAGNKRMVLAPAPVDVVALVEETVAVVTPFASQAGVSLSVEREGDGVVADVDARRIEQAIENILTNAVKFTPRGGSVTVRVGGEGERALISISDTGIGMSAEDKQRVFDRFYRASSVRKNAVQGIGVGLSIVKSIVDAHGGEVTIESEPGEGTTIGLSLPRTRETTPPAEEFALSA
ncbi:sensor histidine kinase [Microbacterium oleivorans]|uniref:sensor histidine kinase n=1 Tax=Microbacterium oleivorans TaxID=273677 RepID=UPI00203D4D06|nr:PAS domain-containing sensor histidine kinase [Microbacterium oleivorans]MCM3695994.1 PAS domain-containing sensor histidine kinase [Microbacterium oleivorans]